MQIKTWLDKMFTLSRIQWILSKIMFSHNNKLLQLNDKWWCSDKCKFTAHKCSSTWWFIRELCRVVQLSYLWINLKCPSLWINIICPSLWINLICLSLWINIKRLSLWWANQVKHTWCPNKQEWFQASQWGMDSSLIGNIESTT